MLVCRFEPALHPRLPHALPQDRRLALPGLTLEWDARVQVAALGQQLAFVLGSPRFRDPARRATAQQHGPAVAWLELCKAQGEAAVSGLAGDFAVALLDLEQGRAMLAVDRFAVHSLAYRAEGGVLAFSDRADRVPGADVAELDPQALLDYLYFHVVPAPATVFAGIRRLDGARRLRWAPDAVEVDQHWRPVFAPEAGRSFNDWRDEFLPLLRGAVSRAGEQGGSLGCFLSGGTDSSTVAGMLAQVRASSPHTYSIGFDAAGYDEMAYARLAARHFSTQQHEYYVTPEDLVAGIPTVAAHYDQPFGNSSVLPAYYCARLARAGGVETLLAGDGGDELFGGNARYAKQKVFEAYRLLPGALRSHVLEPALSASLAGQLPLLNKAKSYVEQALVPLPARMEQYNLLIRLGPAAVLSSGLLARAGLEAVARQQQAVFDQAQGAMVNRMLAYDWKYTLSDNDLPKVSGATALAGVGVRFPLLDDDLVDFSLRLPAAYKVKGLRLRWFFKEALRGFLPEEIISKKKHGFGLPFGVWLAQHPGLQALARESLAGLASRGLINAAFLHDLLETHLPRHPGYYGEMVWVLLMLEQWLRAHRPGYQLPR